ncbi:MAG: DUF4936 family protein [Proteobacteria bacterium]|nr:DUF4936 family protein [Pseudomonadota bacterium]
MSMHLYVYYRAHPELADELQSRVCGMQQTLAERHNITATLQRRPEEKDGRHTWMETYASTPEGFGAILAQAVADANLAHLIDGERHAEYFVNMSCA